FTYKKTGLLDVETRYADLAGMQKIGSTLHGYDESGRQTDIRNLNGQDQVFIDYDYEYDKADQLTLERHHGDTVTYGYDLTGQLTSADHTALADELFRYDRNGNRTFSSLHGAGYVTGTANQLLSDGTFRYSYDKEGNLQTKTEIATGAATTYEY